MRYITELDEEKIKERGRIVKEDERYKSRYRAQAILLSNQGKNINELADIFGCKIRTIYRWFNRFESEKIEGVIYIFLMRVVSLWIPMFLILGLKLEILLEYHQIDTLKESMFWAF